MSKACVNVNLGGQNRTLTLRQTDCFESIMATIKSSFRVVGVPKLFVDQVELTEESAKELDVVSYLNGKTISCEIFNPWNISGADGKGIDYDRLVSEFGVKHLDKSQMERFEMVTGKRAHPWLRRGFFFAHRDFDKILECLEREETIYMYTGRGPSSDSLHLGHIIQFFFAQYLQAALGCVLVVQMSNDEKYMFKDNLSQDDVQRMTYENVKDIIACGYDPDRTFIFSDMDYVGYMYRPVLTLLKHTTAHTASKIYGFDDQSAVGHYGWTCYQAAPAFSSAFPKFFGPPFVNTVSGEQIGPEKPLNVRYAKGGKDKKEKGKKEKKSKREKKDRKERREGKEGEEEGDDANVSVDKKEEEEGEAYSEWTVPCLIPCAVDQDPYFRHARDLAKHLHLPSPATILSKFLPSLLGTQAKMSSSAGTGTGTGTSTDADGEKDTAPPTPVAGSGTAAVAAASSTIFMNMDERAIRRLVNSAYSIGADTLQQQHDTGAKIKDLTQDVPYTYLSIFDLETPDEELLELGQKYLYGQPDADMKDVAGLVTSGSLKRRLADVLVALTQKHQRARAAITDEEVRRFMRLRPLKYRRDGDVAGLVAAAAAAFVAEAENGKGGGGSSSSGSCSSKSSSNSSGQ